MFLVHSRHYRILARAVQAIVDKGGVEACAAEAAEEAPAEAEAPAAE